MRIAVTGALGRIGGGVAAHLRRVGHAVVGIDLREAACAREWDAFFQCDLAEATTQGPARDALREAMRGCSAVVHCAAWPGPSAVPPPGVRAAAAVAKIGLEAAEPARLLRDNVGATQAVCDAAVAAGAGRVVFSSSAFAMGYSHAATGPQALAPPLGTLPLTEASTATPMETYGLSKLCGELALDCAARTALSTSFVSLRFTNIVKRELFETTLPWSDPTVNDPMTIALWNYCHEDDVIEAHVRAALLPEAASPGTHETYILAAPDTRFAAPTEDLLKKHEAMVHDLLQGTPLRPAASSFEEARPLVGNASLFDCSKARNRLHMDFRSWQPTPVLGREAAPSEKQGEEQIEPRGEGRSLRGSAAARRALADPGLEHFDLAGAELCDVQVPASGGTLAYKIHGPPLSEGRPVILHPTSFDAVHDELEYNIGPGATLDTSKYTVIVVNLMGNGVSFSPSSLMSRTLPEEDGALEGEPPLLTVADNVRAQRALLDALGVKKQLELVYGYSMGALQAYEWAVAYPDAVKAVAAVCGASRCSELNAVFLDSLELTLKADGASWDGKRFRKTPHRALAAMGAIYAGWGVGAAWYEDRAYLAAGFQTAQAFVDASYLPAFAACDADDLLSQIRTWRHADVAKPFGGSLEAALGRVQAKCLLMPCDGDRYFTLEAATLEASLLGPKATLVPIRSKAGHRAGDPHRPELHHERAFIRDHVHALLARDAS